MFAKRNTDVRITVLQGILKGGQFLRKDIH